MNEFSFRIYFILPLSPLPLDIFQVAQQDFMVDSSPEVSWLEEMYTVQVRDVHSSLVGRWTVGAVLLHVHAEKTHFCPVYVLECKQRFQSVREGLGHLSAVNKPEKRKQKTRGLREQVTMASCLTLPGCCCTGYLSTQRVW